MLPAVRSTISLWVILVTSVVVLQAQDVGCQDHPASAFAVDSTHQWRPCGPCRCDQTTADCSGQQLTSVPSQASGLPSSTTVLCLRNNSISSLGPNAFLQFPCLYWLDLSNNTITDISSTAFRGLSSLKRLDVSSNRLTLTNGTACSDTPFVLPSVKRLDLSRNYLRNVSCSIVDEVGGRELKWLNLSYNNYSMNGEKPLLLRNLGALASLDVSHNNLTYLQRDLFQGVPALHSLNLSHNDIPLTEEAYPLDAFQLLNMSLAELRLEGNCDASSSSLVNLSYPDRALSVLSRLKVLHMDGLPDTKFQCGFQNMTSLTNFSLSGQGDNFCTMNVIRNDSFTCLPASLWSLNMSECNISKIEPEAFKPLQHLHTLDLSSNPHLGFETLGKAMCSFLNHSDLRELYINFIVPLYAMCVVVTVQHTHCFKHTLLESIHAQDNRIESFCQNALSNMPRTLKYVSLDKNRLNFGSYFKDLSSLVSIRTIHNDGHKIALEPPSVYPSDNLQQCHAMMNAAWSESAIPCHRISRHEDYPVTEIHSDLATSAREGSSGFLQSDKLVFNLPPDLKRYISRWNQLYYHILEVEFNASNSLEELNLSNNLLTKWIGPITGLEKLHTLDIANNFAYELSPYFFNNLTSLRVLNASRNNLRVPIEQDSEGKIFEPLSQLVYLHLADNYLNVVPRNVFKGLKSIETLVLAHNILFKFDVDISHMKNLTMLDLSFNDLRDLPQHVMDHLTSVAQYRKVTVDLTFNPIGCLCTNIDFLMWIYNSGVHFPASNSYSCLKSDGSVDKLANIFTEIQRLQTTCIDKKGILIGTVVCVFFLVVVLVGALIYRFRWKLRYLYYASRLAYRRLDASTGEDRFDFDAFVSYSSENNDFVQGELLDELETRAGLRLNVHSRDFTPGMPIPTNIVGAVQSSRRTLVVLSQDLLQSDWCHYELQMATMEASYTGRDVLVFLLYEDVPSQELSREILYNLKASTYINYPGATADPSQVRDFWERLAQAIKH